MSTLPQAEIKCLFFSEFHHIAGPRISCQVPDKFELKQIFDEVHDLIITKPQLYDRLITVDVDRYRVVGCPKCIDDNKYERNALIFNFVFVFDSSTDTLPYEPLIQKVGNAFKTYEIESSFLSSKHSQPKLSEILSSILRNLNSCGFCTIKINETNYLHLKITPSLQEPPNVENYHVPIFTCTREDIQTTTWDLTIEQILPYINGFNHVKKIADQTEVDISIVKICVQHLVVYGFLKLISIFQYSNVYISLPKLQELLINTELQKECLNYVAIPGCSPSVSDVFKIYCSLESGMTVRDLCERNDLSVLGIDERMLVQYGLMQGLIRHLQKYPVYVRSKGPLPMELQYLLPYLDGSHCFDEICCEFSTSSQELENQIENSPNLLICWK